MGSSISRNDGRVALVLALALVAIFTATTYRQPQRYFQTSSNHKLSLSGRVASDFVEAQPHEHAYSGRQARWADTKDGRACQSLFPWSFDEVSSSSSTAWNRLRADILNASYFPDQHRSVTRFRTWVDDLYGFHSAERLRRSRAHPAPVASVRRILQLAQMRLDDPANNDAVRVLVMGGSVTQGVSCSFNPVGLPTVQRITPQLECAWASRLEHLLNSVLFPSIPPVDDSHNSTRPRQVFEVRNLAVGGTNSETAAMLLEYQLMDQFDEKLPHVVIASFSANDVQDPDPVADFKVHQPNLVRSAQRLRPCDDELPLIILADDLYGTERLGTRAIEQTGRLYQVASWFNVMAVVYPNVAGHAAVANYQKGTYYDPMFGTQSSEIHLGMGFHIAMAWTLLFNIVDAFYETCVDESPNATETTFAEPPTKFKYRGRLAPADAVRADWEANLEEKRRECGSDDPLPTPQPLSPYSTHVCTYAWMAIHQESISEPSRVTAAMQFALMENRGWNASGEPFGNPRTGWYAETPEARFSLQISNITMTTGSIIILSMKSSGPAWVNSKLRVRIRVVRPNSRNKTDDSGNDYTVYGHHSARTSVHFPHKFAIPGGPADIGDTVRVECTLISGEMFKIAGMAFCRK
jgi:hypothetical protein